MPTRTKNPIYKMSRRYLHVQEMRNRPVRAHPLHVKDRLFLDRYRLSRCDDASQAVMTTLGHSNCRVANFSGLSSAKGHLSGIVSARCYLAGRKTQVRRIETSNAGAEDVKHSSDHTLFAVQAYLGLRDAGVRHLGMAQCVVHGGILTFSNSMAPI